MAERAAQLARRLAREAEAVCRHYLPNGRRQGRYWLVGDVHDTPGRSLFVRLTGPTSGKGAAGRWTDAATGEHGDLMDIIRARCDLADFRDVADEARRFLSLPPEGVEQRPRPAGTRVGSAKSARWLFAMSQPIRGTLAETYLRHRAVTEFAGTGCLRFHPRCYYRPDEHSSPEFWPAMIAAVTDFAGHITGVQRTWLDPCGRDKAPIDTPRRAMGQLLGHGVRFGLAGGVMVAGEGIETVMSLRSVLSSLPMVAATSAAHLGGVILPDALRRVYVARDNDPAGDAATKRLIARARKVGIEAMALSPRLGDFNEDLRAFGLDAVRAMLRVQLAPQDVARFMASASGNGTVD